MVPNNKFSLLIMSVLTAGVFTLATMAFCYAAKAGVMLVQSNVGLLQQDAMPAEQAVLKTFFGSLGIAVFLFILGSIGTYLVSRQWLRINHLQTKGVKVMGTVATIRVPYQEPINRSYKLDRLVTYDYADSTGQLHTFTSVFSVLTAAKLIEGGPIPLIYDPAKPSDHMLDESTFV
jgi:hypothetical protein